MSWKDYRRASIDCVSKQRARIVLIGILTLAAWCREVVEVYHLDPDFTRRSARVKRSAFPIALSSMLVMLVIVAAGGASDPAASLQLEPVGGLAWSNIHLMAAVVGTTLIALAFLTLWSNLVANGKIITEIVGEVKRIRTEKGLPN